MDFFSLKGKTVIVISGNDGLGQALIMALAKADTDIFVPSFIKNNSEVKEIIEKRGVGVDFMQVDITVEGALQKIIAAYCGHFGTVDILVSNIGICKLNRVLDFDHTDWDPMTDVGLTAAFELSYEAAKVMTPQRGGKIINIYSLSSYLGGQQSPVYSATEHALAGFIKACCDELGQYNIQVSGIVPGYYTTDTTLAAHSNPEASQRIFGHTPVNRWGGTQDLMGAAVSPASPASNYVNGRLLAIDGGYLAC